MVGLWSCFSFWAGYMALWPAPTLGSQPKYMIWESLCGTLKHLQAAWMNLKRECSICHSGLSIITDSISVSLTRTRLEEKDKKHVSYSSTGITSLQWHLIALIHCWLRDIFHIFTSVLNFWLTKCSVNYCIPLAQLTFSIKNY